MSLTITIPGAVNVTTGSFAPAVLTIGVGVPGSQGPQGPAGQGVPVGGTAGQFLTKINGTDYNTDWTTVNLSAYAVKANNLSDLTSASTARSNLGLGTMATATAADYSTTTVANGLYYPLTGNPSSFLTSSALTGYATQSFVASNYAPIAAGLPTGGTVGQVLTKNSGTDYDDSWQTLIPGDRYLTTSTTSNTIGNGAKTFTVGTGLSYSSQQDVVISFDAANHMHAVVTSYNSGTGVLVVDVRSHTGSGTYSSWTVNVGGTTPLQTVEWGEILGTLGDQTDLANALNAKLETSTAASTYAALAGATFTGEVVTPASTTSNAGLTITPGVAPSTPTNGELWATTNDLQVRLNGVTETIAEQSWVTAGFYPLTGNPSSFLVAADITGKANLSGATFTGLVGTVASTTTTAGLNLPHGTAPTTPVNGDLWTTTGGLFWRQNGTTQQAVEIGSTQTISGNKTFSNANLSLGTSTAAGTINVGTGATISGSTKTINIGTAGVSGSTTNITLGTTSGGGATITLQNNTTVNANLTTTGTASSISNSTATQTLSLAAGATVNGATKAVNIGTGGVSGSTTNITIGTNSGGTSNTTLVGNTTGVTAAADTNSTALATTAYVVGQAGSATPLVDGTAAVGTSLRYARQDHVHPTDTTRAPLDSPAFTGTPSLPTGTTAVTQTAGNNTTAVATTAFVQAAIPSFATTTQLLAGTSLTTGINPLLLRHALSNPGYTQYSSLLGNYSSYTGGAGTGLSIYSDYVSPYITSGGAKIAVCPSSAVNVNSFQGRGVAELAIDWTKPMWIGFRFHYPTAGNLGDTNTVCRVSVGKTTSFFGDLTSAGFGVKFTGGSTGAFTIMAHNGTTLTTSASAVTVSNTTYFPSTTSAADFLVYSDGAGNITLFCNNTQVATTTGGPSTGTTVQGRFAFETDNTTSTSGICAPTYSGIRSLLAY